MTAVVQAAEDVVVQPQPQMMTSELIEPAAATRPTKRIRKGPAPPPVATGEKGEEVEAEAPQTAPTPAPPLRLLIEKCVKDHLKTILPGLRCAEGTVAAVNARVLECLDGAAARAVANKRVTVMPQDV